MRISYSRYTAFLQNPERYRLKYLLGLSPENDDAPTRWNIGRRRGSCFHKLYEGEPREELVVEYTRELVERCERMRAVVPDFGPMILVEHEFDLPILDGKHSIHGFIDHGFFRDSVFRIGDFKTTKGTRTKAEFSKYLGEMETSPQKDFYLKAANDLGHKTNLFTYHIVLDAKSKDHTPTYLPLDLEAGPLKVERTMKAVYAACEAIEFFTNEYGIDRPWPHPNHWPCTGDKFFCGYQTICGRDLAKGCEPHGFTNQYADLIQLEEAD
jgi:hypothetical protein